MDAYETRLKEVSVKLKECQKQKFGEKEYAEAKYSSCMQCELLLSCELRAEYVDAVYKSMNKEHGGGFEF